MKQTPLIATMLRCVADRVSIHTSRILASQLHDRQRLMPIAPAALVLVLAGCGGAHLYDADKDALGKEAKAQFAKTTAVAVYDPQRENLKAFAERSGALAERHARFARDNAIVRLLEGQSLNTMIAKRESALGVQAGTTDLSRKIEVQHITLASARGELTAAAQDVWLLWGLEPPACDAALPDAAALPGEFQTHLEREQIPALKTRLKESYDDYVLRCQTLVQRSDRLATSVLALPDGSALKSTYGEILNARVRLNGNIKEAARAKAEVARSERAVKDAVVKAPSLVAPEVLARGRDLSKALEGLDGAAIAVGLGKEAAARKRIESINTVLKAVIDPPEAEAKAPAKDDAGAEPNAAAAAERKSEIAAAKAILKTMPTLADQVAAIDADLNAPPISALLMERARQQAILEQAQRTITRAQDRIGALESQFEALLLELSGLRQARLNNKQFAAAAKHYADAVYQGERGRALADAQLNDIDHQMAVDSSLYAYTAYQAVLDTPINQIAAYHAAGVKPEELARLIVTGAGLGAIAGRL
ncbi:hypothetical protein ABNQ39_22595 [Azospirillum sp. A26]|uniref:hypothetical protein n=1 Tax=Azospirillum sp. A26 TaxID=3160607 RepID=UPI00366DB5C9